MSECLGFADEVRKGRWMLTPYFEDHLESYYDCPLHWLEWEANDYAFRLELDYKRHMTHRGDRSHYGAFVMPFEVDLDIESFAPRWDPDFFIGVPRHFNGWGRQDE